MFITQYTVDWKQRIRSIMLGFKVHKEDTLCVLNKISNSSKKQQQSIKLSWQCANILFPLQLLCNGNKTLTILRYSVNLTA